MCNLFTDLRIHKLKSPQICVVFFFLSQQKSKNLFWRVLLPGNVQWYHIIFMWYIWLLSFNCCQRVVIATLLKCCAKFYHWMQYKMCNSSTKCVVKILCTSSSLLPTYSLFSFFSVFLSLLPAQGKPLASKRLTSCVPSY